MDERRLDKFWALFGPRWAKQLATTAGVALLAPALSWVMANPDAGRSLAAALMLAGGLASLPRKAIHIRLGYHRAIPVPMLVETAIVVAWIGVGIAFALSPPPLPVFISVAIGLWLCVLVAAAATLRAAKRADLPRVSDVVKHCDFVIELRDVMGWLTDLRFFRFLDERWDDVPAKGKASGFVVWTAGMLLFAVAAAGVTGSPEAQDPPRSTGSTTVVESPSSTPTSTAAPTATTTATATPEPARAAGYTDVCAGAVTPGFPADPPHNEALYALWLGGPGTDGAGALVAGCSDRARRMKHHPDVWWAAGRCGALVLSLGLSVPGTAPVMLLGQVARSFHSFAKLGTLTGASQRLRIGRGDFQVVQTDAGDYVAVRKELTDGRRVAVTGAGVQTCGQFDTGAARYTIVAPGLVDLWLLVVADGWAWPEADGQKIRFRTTDGKTVATAVCDDDQLCTLAYGGRIFHGEPHGRVDAGSLSRRARVADG